MNPTDYRSFTDRLLATLSADARVVGLVALGSMAADGTVPDAHSDHDFFVVTQPGEQPAFRAELSWLPNADRIVVSYPETAHGLKVLFRGPHLAEFAVFDRDELSLARVNRYRVLLDRGGVADTMVSLRERTTRETSVPGPNDAFHAGQVLTILYVGVCRHRRGERMSANQFVRVSSLYHLIPLIVRHVPSDNPGILDNLDPMRRFEMAYPQLGAEIAAALDRPVEQAARGLLELMERELAPRVADFPMAGIEALRAFLEA